MKFTTASPLILFASAQAQTLQSLLGSPGLTNLTTILSRYPALAATLSSATDITILAPADGARGLERILASTSERGQALINRFSPGIIESTLTYHVLKGSFPASAIPEKAFVETLLTNTNYSSVTGGQRLQVEKSTSGVVFTSALGTKSKVTKADIKFNGGYIHLIDAVLTPPQTVAATAFGSGLTTLARTLNSTGLLSTVEGLKDVTIFAPTNAAFATAQSTIATLSEAQVKGALTYHVAKGVAFSTSLKNGQQVPTVNGKPLVIKIDGDKVFVNNAKVIKTDILTKNGVVHVIDSVLVPSA